MPVFSSFLTPLHAHPNAHLHLFSQPLPCSPQHLSACLQLFPQPLPCSPQHLGVCLHLFLQPLPCSPQCPTSALPSAPSLLTSAPCLVTSASVFISCLSPFHAHLGACLQLFSQHLPSSPQSQNHRMVGIGRDLCGSSSPTLLPKQGKKCSPSPGPSVPFPAPCCGLSLSPSTHFLSPFPQGLPPSFFSPSGPLPHLLIPFIAWTRSCAACCR